MMRDYFADLSPAVPGPSPVTGDTENRSAMLAPPVSPSVPGRFEHILVEAVAGTSWTEAALWEALATEDRADVEAGEVDADTLRGFIRVVEERRAREAGRVPEHYTERAWCECCGPVWLWISATVQGCTWCSNRLDGRPIPRPDPVK